MVRFAALISGGWKWAVGAASGLLVLAAVIGLYYSWGGRQETESATLLSKAVSQLGATTQNGYEEAKQADGLRLLQEVVTRYPKSAAAAEATLRLGTLYYIASNFDEARAAYIAYLDKNPKGQIAFSVGLGVGDTYLAQHEFEKAAETYSGLIEQFPNEALMPEAQMRLARAYLGLNRRQDALGLYQKVVQASPNSGWAESAQAEMNRLAIITPRQ